MNIEEILEHIRLKNIDKLQAGFDSNEDEVEKHLEEYEPSKHEISRRLDKQVILKDGSTKTVTLWKLAIPYQKKIVNAAVAFLFGKPVKLVEQSEGTNLAFDELTRLWDDMRMNSKNKETARKLFSETEVAKLFVPYRDADADAGDLTKPNSVKCLILAKSLGDTLYTSFDEYGVMTGFARGYEVKKGKDKEEHFDLYTKDFIFLCRKAGKEWEIEAKPNLIGKIPVVYYNQQQPEWADVEPLIKRLEWLTSTRSDVNDYTADPILVLEGDVVSMPDKDSVGKVVQLEQGAKASYLSPQMVIEMVKDEREHLKQLIHYCTDTPDLSLESMSSLGQDSGKALEMKFFSAILKAMDKQEVFSEMMDREINILKAIIGKVINTGLNAQADALRVGLEFGNPLPDNVEDMVNMLNIATGGKATMSQEAAIRMNPLVKDADEVYKQVQQESREEGLIEPLF